MKSEIRNMIVKIEPDGAYVKVSGRDCWLLHRLMQAATRGVTTMELPAGVRVSHSIWKLRRAGLIIESVEERHGGEFAGRHARYILRSNLSVVSDKRRSDAVGVAA